MIDIEEEVLYAMYEIHLSTLKIEEKKLVLTSTAAQNYIANHPEFEAVYKLINERLGKVSLSNSEEHEEKLY